MVGVGGIVDPVGAGVGAGVTADVDGAGGIVVPLGAGVEGVGAVLGVGAAVRKINKLSFNLYKTIHFFIKQLSGLRSVLPISISNCSLPIKNIGFTINYFS